MTRATKAITLFAAVVALSGSTLTAAPPAQRPYSAGSFGLELDGAFAGYVSRIEGGNVVGDVAKVPGTEFFVKKQLANVGVRDIVLEFGTNMTLGQTPAAEDRARQLVPPGHRRPRHDARVEG